MHRLAPYDCKGIHILADFWGVERNLLCDVQRICQAIEQAAIAGGATILNTNFHVFGPQQGVTGVALLAESHLSIHTWPEQQMAAIDIYMCGATYADQALLSLKASMQPAQVTLHRHERGLHPSSRPAPPEPCTKSGLNADLTLNVR